MTDGLVAGNLFFSFLNSPQGTASVTPTVADGFMASLFTEMVGDILYPQQERKSTGREGKGSILDLD